MNLFGLMETSGARCRPSGCAPRWWRPTWPTRRPRAPRTGGPYRRQEVVFAADGGDRNFLDSMNAAAASAASIGAATRLAVGSAAACPCRAGQAVAPGVHIAQVVEDPSPPLKRYDPGHPDAGPDGYVSYPDINPLTEMVDLMGATRAYGLNGSAVQAEKGMITSALEIAKS